MDKEQKEIIKSYNNIIGKNFKNLRMQKKFTQEQVADISDVTPEYLSKFESGVYNASIYNIITLCKAIDISPIQLIRQFFNNSSSGLSEEILFESEKLTLDNQKIILLLLKALNKQVEDIK